jgi:hypothetical protein
VDGNHPVGRAPSSAPPPCAEAGLIQGMGLPAPDDWATEFRTALSCGVYKVAGTEQVNGTHLTKLTPVRPAPATTLFWIDAVTYLPVRAEIVYGNGDTDNEVQDVEVFQWLPADRRQPQEPRRADPGRVHPGTAAEVLMRRSAQAGAAGWFQVVAAHPGNPDVRRVQGDGADGEQQEHAG